MAKLKQPYSLLEVLAVMAVLGVVTSLMLASFYRFRQEFSGLIEQAPEVREVGLFHARMMKAADQMPGPLAASGGKVFAGGRVAAEIAGREFRIRNGGELIPLRLPARMTAVLAVEDEGRTLILTLSPERAAGRRYRLAASTAGEEGR